MAWQTPKTNWQAADVVSKDDFNRTEGNVQELQNTKETPAGAQSKVNAALNSAKQYTYQEVAEVSQELDAHKAAAAPHSGHETPAGAQAKAEAAAGAVRAELNAHLADEAAHGIDAVKNDIVTIKKRVEMIPGTGIISWAEVQSIVRAGEIGNYLQVGDQFVSLYDGKEIIWEVIGIDHDTPVDTNYTHSLTLQTKDCLHNIQFDAKEPNNPNGDRQSYGNNRYIHSAVKQWLNSDQPAFVWKSQHSYDATPTDSLDLYNGAGFLHRLDPDLVAVLGAVNKKVARNTVTDSGGQDTFSDKVFLLSPVEVGFGTEGDTTGEIVYPYYNGISNAGRIKLLNGSVRYWWLRSPYVTSSDNVRRVHTDGTLYYSGADGAIGVAPACVII